MFGSRLNDAMITSKYSRTRGRESEDWENVARARSNPSAVQTSQLPGLTLLSLLVWLLCGFLAMADVQTDEGTTWTSLIRILATPEKYDGKRVQLCGYYFRSFETSGLFLGKKDAKLGNIQNAIWVSLPELPKKNDRIQKLKRGYVKIIGTFRFDPAGGHGHMGIWPGEIKDVTFLQKVK